MEVGGFRFLPVNAGVGEGGDFSIQDVMDRTVERLRRYDEALSREDPLGVVIRGLIYIDDSLRYLICSSNRSPKLKKLKNDYSSKGLVRLAESLGLVENDFGKVIREFIELRNAFAHEIERELTDGDVLCILQTIRGTWLDDAYQVELGNHLDQDHNLGRLRVVIRVINERLLTLWYERLTD